MQAPVPSFDDHLAREIMHSERMRMAILAGLLAALILLSAPLYPLFYQRHQGMFLPLRAYAYIVSVLGLLIVYELAIRRLIGGWLDRGRTVPSALRYLNAFIETSVPTLLMLLISREVGSLYVVHSAASLLYGVFIVLSTLRLDFRLSVFTGAVAAVEYVALSIASIDGAARAAPGTPFELPPYYLGKGAMLMLAGLAAGFVAIQLKRRVGNAYHQMQERQRVLDAFGQQIPPAIVDRLLKDGPEIASIRAFVCIMFMDIRDFTPLVENKTPEQIVALQNIVFAEAAEVVNRHQGIVNQFLGDGFMATFGAPLASGNCCVNALAAARELLAAIGGLAQGGRIPAIRIGVGLHAGQVVAGNIGSARRKQYSITGNAVILASRIEQLNKRFSSQILASGEVLQAAGERGPASLGPVQVKGREEPIEIYRVA